MPLSHVAGIECGILERADLRPMAGLLAESFSRHEPISRAVGLSSAELEGLVMAFGPKALAERLSLVARDVHTGDLVGALLAQDFSTPPPDGIADIAPSFAPIGALLDGLDDRYRASREIAPGTCLHLFMLGVARHGHGRGIADHLLKAGLANGKARGYRFAVGEATGNVSQHLCRKNGFRDVLAASYKDFVFDGRHVFSSIVGPEATILMDREL